MGNRYLIDTHILLWWVFNDHKIDNLSREIIQNPNHQILVSSASIKCVECAQANGD